MMKYEIIFSLRALKDIAKIKRNEPKVYKKVIELLEDMALHPYSGIGKPEQLCGNRRGQWSRRVSSKHRLVYEIDDNIITVYVLSCLGHYEDK
jgi:toxin YoeB